MNPSVLYRRLNREIWFNRLPQATIVFVDNDTLPLCYGLTIRDEIVRKPVIFLNRSMPGWTRTLIHEMLHIAEPKLRHGKLFDTLVEIYVRFAQTLLRKPRKKS